MKTNYKKEKLKYLRICLSLWSWLVKNPLSRKEEWVGWKKHGEMTCDCPCCEYDLLYGLSDCVECPMRKEFGTRELVCPCNNDKSPFPTWSAGQRDKDEKKARAAAKEMVELIRSAIRRVSRNAKHK